MRTFYFAWPGPGSPICHGYNISALFAVYDINLYFLLNTEYIETWETINSSRGIITTPPRHWSWPQAVIISSLPLITRIWGVKGRKSWIDQRAIINLGDSLPLSPLLTVIHCIEMLTPHPALLISFLTVNCSQWVWYMIDWLDYLLRYQLIKIYLQSVRYMQDG